MEETKSIYSSFKEVTAALTFTEGDGGLRRTRLTAAFEAVTFAEAETSAARHFSQLGDDVEIINITPAPYSTVILSGNDGKWFRVKVKFITVNERTGKEKRTASTLLVQAGSSDRAQKYVTHTLGDIAEYEVAVISETAVHEVILQGDEPETTH